MSYESVEQSKERGTPYEKYQFQYGPTGDDSYRYINGLEDVGEFIAIPIERAAYQTTGKAERDQLNIRLPATTDLAKLVLPYPPPYTVLVTIWAGHYDDGEDMVIWSGRVLSNAFEGGTVTLTCESTLLSLRRNALRRRWQPGCPLLLYGSGVGQCNAVRSDFTVEATVAAVDDGMPVFAAGWEGSWDKSQFVGGMIRWESEAGVEFRTIRDVTEIKVKFNGVLRGIEVGEVVKLILGCNHKRTDCKDVFDNIHNYGGDDWLPLENPVKHPNFW